MSWSIQFIGKPAKVSKALEDYSNKISGASKTEYDAALPHFKALVEQNFNKKEEDVQLIRITANGHGYSHNGEESYRNLNVTIEPITGTLVD